MWYMKNLKAQDPQLHALHFLFFPILQDQFQEKKYRL